MDKLLPFLQLKGREGFKGSFKNKASILMKEICLIEILNIL